MQFLLGPAGTNPPTVNSTHWVCVRYSPRRKLTVQFGVRLLLAVLAAFPIFAAASKATSRARLADGIRLELPASGQIRVENQHGSVTVEVWNDKAVSVQVITSNRTSENQSPLVIDRRNDILLISAAGTDDTDLVLKIPANARLEVVTGTGLITTQGLPASLSLNTSTGNIRSQLTNPIDADIIARSISGLVKVDLGSVGSSDDHLFQARFAPGTHVLRATSQRGEIRIDSLISGRAQSQSRPPELQAAARISGAGTPANQNPNEEFGDGDTIRVDSQLVTMNLSVIDRGTNRGVFGLNRSDFKLLEDGVEQRIVQFDSASAPFDLVLVIDLSGSTRDVVKLIRGAALRFVAAARAADRIAIITFAGQASVVSPLTLDREALRRRINGIDTLAGDTKLYDACSFAMDEVLREARNSRRIAVVLMSDGLDGSIEGVQGEGSRLRYSDLLGRVREFDGVFYNLWLDTYYEALNEQDTQPEAFDTGHDRMQEMAEAGGGLFYEVESLEDLAGAYERVVADLGTVYSLSYRPANKARDGKWRAIKVSIDRTNAVARGKRGYYAN